MKVYRFPSDCDRDMVHLYVGAYARGTITRQEMMSWVAGILDSYGVTKMYLDGYRVRKLDSIVTRRGVFPVVVVEATRTVKDGRCPACGSCHDRYLAGEAPEITVWCMSCECIYQKEVPHEATGKSG